MRRCYFCVLTMPRSGSTWLISLLKSHPEISPYGELFLMRPVAEKNKWLVEQNPDRFIHYKTNSKKIRPLALFSYMKYVHNFSNNYICGFKIMANQLKRFPELIFVLLFYRYRILFLVRENTLESCISEYISRAAGLSHSTTSSKVSRVRINPDKLIKDMLMRQRRIFVLRTILSILPIKVHEIRYHELREKPQDECKSVFRFLGLSNIDVAVNSDLRKQVSSPYREVLENYDDIARALERAGLADNIPKH